MKRKNKTRKILLSVTALVLTAALGLGIWVGIRSGASEPVAVFPFYYVGMTEYWGDTQESYGYVQTDSVQTVYLSDTQTVTEIYVKQGDQVKKGDVLMAFDTTLSDLALERKRLDVEKLKLQLQDAKERLAEINAMKPMVIPQPSEDPDEEVDLGELLTEPFRISENTDYDGSKGELALICWLHSGQSVTEEVLAAVTEKALEYQSVNAEKQEPEDPGEPPAEDPTGGSTEAPAEDPTEAPSEAPSEPEMPSEPEDPSQPEEPEQPGEPELKGFYVVFKITEGNQSLGVKTTWQGMYVIPDPETGNYSFQFFDASLVQDHMLAPDEDAEEEPEIDYGSGYTAAQIAQMRQQQEKTIRDLEFSIKMAEADYKIMQTEVSDGKVYAAVDGTVVSLLSPDEAIMMQQPLIKVSGGGGFYVEGTVGELDRETMYPGQEVSITDWYSGMTYVGTVESLGDYPSSDGYWNGMGNPNSTYYPFRVFVSESADLQAGSYVSIIFSAGESQNGVYLENPFIRTENGQSYVYVRGEDGKLEKRYVTTGKSLWGSYTEILDGLSEEDFIAFPYGKTVKPGAETVESDLSALYE